MPPSVVVLIATDFADFLPWSVILIISRFVLFQLHQFDRHKVVRQTDGHLSAFQARHELFLHTRAILPYGRWILPILQKWAENECKSHLSASYFPLGLSIGKSKIHILLITSF